MNAPAQLAYSFRWEPPDPQDVETVVSISLLELGESTRLTMDQGVFATEARREHFTSKGGATVSNG